MHIKNGAQQSPSFSVAKKNNNNKIKKEKASILFYLFIFGLLCFVFQLTRL